MKMGVQKRLGQELRPKNLATGVKNYPHKIESIHTQKRE
jgi:hypothetical protein